MHHTPLVPPIHSLVACLCMFEFGFHALVGITSGGNMQTPGHVDHQWSAWWPSFTALSLHACIYACSHTCTRARLPQEYCGCAYSLRDTNEYRRKEGQAPVVIAGEGVYSDAAADSQEESLEVGVRVIRPQPPHPRPPLHHRPAQFHVLSTTALMYDVQFTAPHTPSRPRFHRPALTHALHRPAPTHPAVPTLWRGRLWLSSSRTRAARSRRAPAICVRRTGSGARTPARCAATTGDRRVGSPPHVPAQQHEGRGIFAGLEFH